MHQIHLWPRWKSSPDSLLVRRAGEEVGRKAEVRIKEWQG